jgi:hypothetical protein
METILDAPRATTVMRPAEPASRSAASWPAIIAGAFVAVAVALVLFALGTGLGFAMVSPWQEQGVSVTTFAVTTAIWLIVIEWLSSAAGGYMAGRLRTRWVGTQHHEVFFRDTAHGFVTWAVATVIMATVAASAVSTVVTGGVHAATAVTAAAGAAGAAGTAGGNQEPSLSGSPAYPYGVDKLFRPPEGAAAATTGTLATGMSDPRTEVAHVLAQALTGDGTVPEADRTYLVQLVAAHTGVPSAEAQRRVNEFITAMDQARDKLKAAADAARRAAAKAAIFGALALAIGAFISCLTAALGGKLRDEHP